MTTPLVLPSRLSCGMVMAAQDPVGIRDLSQQIEAAGFDSIWAGDHVSFYIPIMESLTLLSYVAACTERVRLCTGIYLMPLRHPTTTAKVTSTLDVLCDGRFTLGVGVGGEFPPEFEACGVPIEERGKRTDEGIEVLRRLWNEEKVAYEGTHYRFGPVSINPKPVQSGGPPIIIGGRRGASFRRAGQLGDGYISHMCSAEQYRENMSEIAEQARRAGREDVPFEPMSFLFTVFDDDYEKALERAANMLQMIYNRPFKDAARKYCLLGRPEDCLEQLQDFARAGSRHFVFSMLSDASEFIEAYEAVIKPELPQIDL
jgi:probable F420-dependent oxidoreductase